MIHTSYKHPTPDQREPESENVTKDQNEGPFVCLSLVYARAPAHLK